MSVCRNLHLPVAYVKWSRRVGSGRGSTQQTTLTHYTALQGCSDILLLKPESCMINSQALTHKLNSPLDIKSVWIGIYNPYIEKYEITIIVFSISLSYRFSHD